MCLLCLSRAMTARNGVIIMTQIAPETAIHTTKESRATALFRRVWGMCRHMARAATDIGACFLLSFADLAGIPSGFHAAWLAAMAAEGMSLLRPMLGCVLALLLRLAWGLEPRWTMLATLACMLPAQRLLFREKSSRMMLWTAFALLPGIIQAVAGGTQRAVMYAFASAAISMLAAPVLYRARCIWHRGREVATVEEGLALGYAAALLICGGARMLLPGVNIGAFGAAFLTLTAAMVLGASAGCVTGLVSGAVLALQGVPMQYSVSLAMGGFLSGLTMQYRHRGATCACFLLTVLAVLMLASSPGVGLPGAAIASAVTWMLMPERWRAWLQTCCMRFGRRAAVQDAYSAVQLSRWEHGVEDMIRAFPAPERIQMQHDAPWWRIQLCDGCPEAESCAGMTTDAAAARADEVLLAMLSGRGEQALDGLRGLGCARLYYMRENMLRQCVETERLQKCVRQACYERDMQTTHFAAMSGAARRMATLAEPGWWDGLYAGRLKQAASELAMPCTLLYARQIDGHAELAWAVDEERQADELSEELCRLSEAVTGLPMECAVVEAERVFLSEKAAFRAEAACASRGKLRNADENGDVVRMCRLRDGRFLIAVSDGMGHGAQARRESGQTVAMLHLCLDAGYLREQALTVVNGMMLSATQGERFATVDLMTVDLRSGRMTLDKLGAANSYWLHNGALTCMQGDALPLGILEKVESRACECQLEDGDAIVLMTDGVEDAFASPEALEAAIQAALKTSSAQEAADLLLEAADSAAGHIVRDDQTAVVLRLVRQLPPETVKRSGRMRTERQGKAARFTGTGC